MWRKGGKFCVIVLQMANKIIFVLFCIEKPLFTYEKWVKMWPLYHILPRENLQVTLRYFYMYLQVTLRYFYMSFWFCGVFLNISFGVTQLELKSVENHSSCLFPYPRSTWCALLGLHLRNEFCWSFIAVSSPTLMYRFLLYFWHQKSWTNTPDKSASPIPLWILSSSSTCFASCSHVWAWRAAQPVSKSKRETHPQT